ncbi:MAG: hypothetical protein GF408_03915 [Candidatus Omnitrophica bacterium]|nr:hypothetical protein [Candidatus Omnitrophota bacterium]
MFGFLKRRRWRRFGEIAVSKGLASRKDIEEAIKTQKEYAENHKVQREIGAILTEKGILTPDDVKSILEEQQKNQDSLMAWFSAFFGLSR